MSDECIAIITARGGSTRVPRNEVHMQKKIFLREKGNAWFHRDANQSTPPLDISYLYDFIEYISKASASAPTCFRDWALRRKEPGLAPRKLIWSR